ncbi:hypothetical protein LL965_20035 [Xanthomonas cassavae CFBP 4642]|uniref:HNH endonuclease n=1 Tax=Xanthomonas cassavae CFBP 4642 TaxID=1219375 RepID=A0ABS8HJ47_9XANT|nr:hypothetical protein [Xanthomonas cassavae]MCC4622228.1 hypothetical protein [Xanthomonas cassavae CFBP 4642]
MNWIPDNDRNGNRDSDHKHGHVTPPFRNPVPEREQQQDGDRDEPE